jgi:predicted O-methyltransferase YrrM
MEIKYLSKEIIKQFKETMGAMSVSEGIALYNICLQSPSGYWVELGSHKGKSTTMIAAAMYAKEGTLHLVEPEFANNDWELSIRKQIWSLLPIQSFITDSRYSTDVFPEIKDDLSFLFVDSGNHGEEIVQSERPLYEDKMIKGGIIAFHDYGSQFTAVARCYDQLISSGKYEPIHINWQPIFDYVAEHNLEEGNNSWHLYPELPHPPNFIGALRRK